MDKLLSVKEVAEILSVNPMTVYRLVETGELPHVRIGSRTIRISREALDAYTQPKETKGPVPQNTITRAPVTRL